MASTFAFLAFSAAVVVAAWRVVTSPNIIRAGLALVVVLAGLAPIYLMLAAEFVAVIQILVYVGAVVILFLFGIMLTRSPSKPEETEAKSPQRWFALAVSTALFVLLAFAINDGGEGRVVNAKAVGTTEKVGDLLLRDFVIPFEVISVLLLAALIGAIVIARRDPSERSEG